WGPRRDRRGLVLLAPPFEARGELDRIPEHLARAHRKWATGIYLLWYPIKDPTETDRFARRVARLGIPKILRAEVTIGARTDKSLTGTGLLPVNPPVNIHTEPPTRLPA